MLFYYSWWNFIDSWILDSRCSFMYPYKDWFDTHKECDVNTIPMGSDSILNLSIFPSWGGV